MNNSKKSNYFVSLDIGTNSIGYAVTSEDYNLLKYKQHPMWGVHLFESAKLAQERRTFRAARRRLDRRQQRIQLLRELFAGAISTIDPKFFQRIDSSAVKKNADALPYAIFADADYDDRDFYHQYPTIHHLIAELIESDQTYDVRLVYLACAWLLGHRGHFFSDVDKEKVDEIVNFSAVYDELQNFVEDHGYTLSWKYLDIDISNIGDILKSSKTKTVKYKELAEYLQLKKKKSNVLTDEVQWFDEGELLKLLCGSKVKNVKVFPDSDYAEADLVLEADDDKIAEIVAALTDDDAALFLIMKKIFDWSILADIIGNGKNISSSKVMVYEKHKSDLKNLKYIVRKYLPRSDYADIFRSEEQNNYAVYSGSVKHKRVTREDFYKFIAGKLKKISIDDNADMAILDQINQDIATEKFLPKQVTSDNRTIPYQLYWNELKHLLDKASVYLPFLLEQDEDGLSVQDKILSIMEFRVPYFVGPMNSHSSFAWFKRKADGRILPWNIEDKVDYDASEEAFIKRMINSCTYLPGEPSLPKHSILYQHFEVLNLLNAIQVNGTPISVECKQEIYKLFGKHSKVSKKTILAYLRSSNRYQNLDADSITGIDDTVTSSLSSWRIFHPLIASDKLTAAEAEEIINKRTFTEDTSRFRRYLRGFAKLSAEDIKWLSAKKFTGFGRLSRKFLTEPVYLDPKTGNKLSLINMMWDYNLNLQQLLSDRYPFGKMVERARSEYYAHTAVSLPDRLDDMYISNAVKRPIIRSLTVLDEIVQVMDAAPAKIFIEMAREVTEPDKKQRTISRRANLQAVYQELADEDVRQLSLELEKYDDAALQKDTLYLYFMQLGKDMYTGETITDLSLYNKEHIYPRSKVKDDSIDKNIVLVNSQINGEKTDIYPIDASIRAKMTPFWTYLKDKKLISPEKFARLTRSTPFSDDEKWGFINRQLVETRQSTKAVAELLAERYPDTEIVYVKAGLVSDFRKEFDLVKSRVVNDLHHGKDAYLNIVVGNVWHEYFTRKWFVEHDDKYSVKPGVVFGFPRKNASGQIIWQGAQDIELVKTIMKRNYLHLTNYTYCQKGGFFDQNPLPAGEDLIPLKKDKPTSVYGGYRKPTATFFALALTEETGRNTVKRELTLVPVDLLVADKFITEEPFRIEYIKKFIDPAGQKNLSVQFPLGIKPIKIKTVFEVDNGLRFRLNGKSSGGSILLISMCSPLLLDSDWERYIKRLESYCEKKRKNPQLIYSAEYDKFTVGQNVKLYDCLLDKLSTGMFALRPANPQALLLEKREEFIALPADVQAEILLGMISSFGSGSGAGVDLTAIGGVKKAGVTTLSSKLSNWKKIFTTARIVYSDSSGLHETKSIDLLDLI